MNIKILNEFVKRFRDKDIDKRFDKLIEFKRLRLYDIKGE